MHVSLQLRHNSLVPRLSSTHALEPGNEATYTTNVTLELSTKTKDATIEKDLSITQTGIPATHCSKLVPIRPLPKFYLIAITLRNPKNNASLKQHCQSTETHAWKERLIHLPWMEK